jgi:DNA polymerase III epsilon subunit-like protein
MKLIWADTETTGLNYEKDRLVEIALLYENIGDNVEKDTYHTYLKYNQYPDNYKEAVKITGLTTEILEKRGVQEGHAYSKLCAFLDSKMDRYDKNDKAILCGYNVNFDNQFLRTMFKRFKNDFYGSYFLNCRIDVMSVVAQAIKNGVLPFLSNYKLITVANHLKMEFKSHSAIDDIKITRNIYNHLEKELKK